MVRATDYLYFFSMKILTEFPFIDFTGYIVTNKENRKTICLVNKNTRKRLTMSYARYLMCVKEKRILRNEEHVDHIDNDKTNDSINNLQILTQEDNNKKSRLVNNINRKLITLKCPECEKIFTKPYNKSHFQKGGYFDVCSKECLYKINKKKLSRKELISLGENQIIT